MPRQKSEPVSAFVNRFLGHEKPKAVPKAIAAYEQYRAKKAKRK